MGDWTQALPTNKTSAPLAALAFTSGKHFGEKTTVFSSLVLTHEAGDTLLGCLRDLGEMRYVKKGEGEEKVGILPYSPQLFCLESATVTFLKKNSDTVCIE